jgi:dolichyl-phosphate-mannose-protein mannosyltransferase
VPTTVEDRSPAHEPVSLSRTSDGETYPLAADRGRFRFVMNDVFLGWFTTISVALVALFLRLWKLGEPKSFLFDETYYAKDAWSLLHYGHAMDYKDQIDATILDGQTTDLWKTSPSMNVHPEVGKWMIALGEKAFGLDPFGWRVASAVTGALMVLVLARLVRRLTGSTLWGCVAGLLLTIDGLHFVLSRLALLDIFLAFWLLCAVSCLVADRDWFRRRLAARTNVDATGRTRGWGAIRGVLFRPWLLAGGVCFGLAVGSKWTALYPLAAFGLLVFAWSVGARRSFGVRGAWWKSALTDGLAAFVHLVVVAAIVYTATWTGWLLNAKTYEQSGLSASQYTTYAGEGHCAEDPNNKDQQIWVVDKTDPGRKWPTATEKDKSGLGEVTQSVRSLWYFHRDVYTFHTDFLNCATHPYQSMPSGWLLLNRTVGVDAQNDIPASTPGCAATGDGKCKRIVTLLGNPVIWWGSCLALIAGAALWIGARDWRWGVALVGTLSTWLPWTLYNERPIFIFYAVATLPFMVMALTLALATIVGRDRGPSSRRTTGVVIAGSFVMLALVAFAFFWPVLTDQLITDQQWLQRMWFSKWI